MPRRYLQLTKPGIVFGNLVSVIGGFMLASRGHVDAGLFLATITGVSLVIASGCTFNNYIDRDIDSKMRRTQRRVLAQGLLPVKTALLFGGVLGILGTLLLDLAANPLSAILVAIGFAVYVGAYSLSMKRGSVHGTLIGSLSGAMPPVVGYCAVTGRFDLGAALLLLIFSLWQMPHSYAIGIVYMDDYRAAGIPVLPVKRGIKSAKKQIAIYSALFTLAAVLPSLAGYTGYFYMTVAAALGVSWLWMAIKGFRAKDDRVWARKIFMFSIIIVMTLCFAMSVDFVR